MAQWVITEGYRVNASKSEFAFHKDGELQKALKDG